MRRKENIEATIKYLFNIRKVIEIRIQRGMYMNKIN